MLDLGWVELAFVAVLALIVVGPKDLPRLARGVGQVVGRVQRFYRESLFNLRRLENEIEVASQKEGRPAYMELLPEHVRHAMAHDEPTPIAHRAQISTAPSGQMSKAHSEEASRAHGELQAIAQSHSRSAEERQHV